MSVCVFFEGTPFLVGLKDNQKRRPTSLRGRPLEKYIFGGYWRENGGSNLKQDTHVKQWFKGFFLCP